MVIEANRCFMSALSFKTMLRIWRQLFVDITQSVLLTQSVLANALTCALPIAVQAVGLIAANKTPEGRKIFRAIPIFFEPPSVVPELIGGSSRTSAGRKLHPDRRPPQPRWTRPRVFRPPTRKPIFTCPSPFPPNTTP